MNHSLQQAITKNFLLKSKVLLGIFCGIFILQVISISSSFLSGAFPTEILLRALFAPVIIATIIIAEYYGYRIVKKRIQENKQVNKSTVYIVTLIETTFPGIMFFYGTLVIGKNNGLGIDNYMLLNSPPELAYFFFIILSSLLLDVRLSLLVGMACGVQYSLVSGFILFEEDTFKMLFTASKGILMIAGGFIAGFVSKKIKESVDDALSAQNILINELDKKVIERTREITLQKAEIEEKNKEITDSIQYARRIQYTLLAHDEILKRNLPQHFVLFQPKDIVSGDFYWATEKNEGSGKGGSLLGNMFYLAVCDSTGHGVPGAFMSLLNTSFLNEAINEKNITAPNEVLDHVRSRLIENMEGGSDGMDASLIKFEKEKISYASANSIPIVIRNGQIMELASDKMPVGKSHTMKNFQLSTFILQPGDTLYLFTDGFADQFGGENFNVKKAGGKKFKKSNLKKLLAETSIMAINDQKEHLLNALEKWKGNFEQVDDVCIIGIKW